MDVSHQQPPPPVVRRDLRDDERAKSPPRKDVVPPGPAPSTPPIPTSPAPALDQRQADSHALAAADDSPKWPSHPPPPPRRHQVFPLDRLDEPRPNLKLIAAGLKRLAAGGRVDFPLSGAAGRGPSEETKAKHRAALEKWGKNIAPDGRELIRNRQTDQSAASSSAFPDLPPAPTSGSRAGPTAAAASASSSTAQAPRVVHRNDPQTEPEMRVAIEQQLPAEMKLEVKDEDEEAAYRATADDTTASRGSKKKKVTVVESTPSDEVKKAEDDEVKKEEDDDHAGSSQRPSVPAIVAEDEKKVEVKPSVAQDFRPKASNDKGKIKVENKNAPFDQVHTLLFETFLVGRQHVPLDHRTGLYTLLYSALAKPKFTVRRKSAPNAESEVVCEFRQKDVDRVLYCDERDESSIPYLEFGFNESSTAFEQLARACGTSSDGIDARRRTVVFPVDDSPMMMWKDEPRTAVDHVFKSRSEAGFTKFCLDGSRRAANDLVDKMDKRAGKQSGTTKPSQSKLIFPNAPVAAKAPRLHTDAAGDHVESEGGPSRRSSRPPTSASAGDGQVAAARKTLAKPRSVSPYGAEEIVFEYPMHELDAVSVTWGDTKRLRDEGFLNDTLIEFGLKRIMENIEKRDRGVPDAAKLGPQIHVFNSFFYQRLSINKDLKRGVDPYLLVEKWTQRVDLFKKRFIVVPINAAPHWYLAIIVNPNAITKPPPPAAASRKPVAAAPMAFTQQDSELGRQEKLAREREEEEEAELGEKVKTSADKCWVLTFDWLGAPHEQVANRVRDYLVREAASKWGLNETSPDDVQVVKVDVPQQPNSCDCGLYLLHYVETFFKNPQLYLDAALAAHLEPSSKNEDKGKKDVVKKELESQSFDLWKGDVAQQKRAVMRVEVEQLRKAWQKVIAPLREKERLEREEYKRLRAEEREEERNREEAERAAAREVEEQQHGVHHRMAPSSSSKAEAKGKPSAPDLVLSDSESAPAGSSSAVAELVSTTSTAMPRDEQASRGSSSSALVQTQQQRSHHLVHQPLFDTGPSSSSSSSERPGASHDEGEPRPGKKVKVRHATVDSPQPPVDGDPAPATRSKTTATETMVLEDD
ncbi:hypothetical protein JCM3775_002863 [Rhodotorula graminis]